MNLSIAISWVLSIPLKPYSGMVVPSMSYSTKAALLTITLTLGACLPIPEVLPERFEPRYLGTEKSWSSLDCSGKYERLFIEGAGPDFISMIIAPRYFPEKRLVELGITLRTDGALPFILESQNISVVPLNGSPPFTAHIISDPTPERILLGITARIENVALETMRVELPVLKIGTDIWRPSALELRPSAIINNIRLIPFNC